VNTELLNENNKQKVNNIIFEQNIQKVPDEDININNIDKILDKEIVNELDFMSFNE